MTDLRTSATGETDMVCVSAESADKFVRACDELLRVIEGDAVGLEARIYDVVGSTWRLGGELRSGRAGRRALRQYGLQPGDGNPTAPQEPTFDRVPPAGHVIHVQGLALGAAITIVMVLIDAHYEGQRLVRCGVLRHVHDALIPIRADVTARRTCEHGREPALAVATTVPSTQRRASMTADGLAPTGTG